ncbi:MAG TPA: tetratricopeptide repeat protein [Candidatus Eisenbacteria bacterium]|nr:tetratricopeptide repeat protein [Candidatus Eisenbacteria bacterium]
MRSTTRHQLKQNTFAETTVETISWAVENRNMLIAAAIAVAVAAAMVLGGWAYVNYRNQQASEELAGALQKYQAPIRAAGEPASPETLSYASAAERAKAANADFTRIADKYSFTRNGRMARYFAGITLHDMGDNAAAEKQLQQVAGSSDKEVASLAKLALASMYQDSGKTQQAIDLYKALIEKPTTSVGKTTAQFELANLYENNHQPLEARKLYEQMQKDYPTSPVGQMAAQKLQTLHP